MPWINLFLFFSISFSQPIQLRPENPHYFSYKNDPIILISSGEHYGAVVNSAFDYVKYLNTLENDNLNYTRIFVGSYIEKQGSFGIGHNTLAPEAKDLIIPFARSTAPGYALGGNLFNLDQWDNDYFSRLKNFLFEAFKRDIIVEVTLFSSYYGGGGWSVSPLNTLNNVNTVDEVKRLEVQTLNNGNLTEYQEKLVRKIVRELNDFDNIFYEIQNEPWADLPGDIFVLNPYDPETDQKWTRKAVLANEKSLEWQKEIAFFITDEESKLKKKHLIAQNYCNFKYPLKEVDPAISILNFHYAWPEVVRMNYGYNRPVCFDESGFSGNQDAPYRKQAWEFILSGGAMFNNLDYSFVPGFEEGTFKNNAPGGGGLSIRQQLKILKDFIFSFDFVNLRPDFLVIENAPGVITRVLAKEGEQYAIYVKNGNQCNLTLKLPRGVYETEWINTITGEIDKTDIISSQGKPITLLSPNYEEDIALKIIRMS